MSNSCAPIFPAENAFSPSSNSTGRGMLPIGSVRIGMINYFKVSRCILKPEVQADINGIVGKSGVSVGIDARQLRRDLIRYALCAITHDRYGNIGIQGDL